jgi:ElaB/YqjD/DUF883 family membrane-anchored ribosome-binding protein
MTPSENHTFPSTQSDTSVVRGNGPDADAEISHIERQLSVARQKMADTMVAVQDKSHQMIESATGTIHRRPLTALAVATVVGIAIGYLLAESRSSSLSSILHRRSLPHRWHW